MSHVPEHDLAALLPATPDSELISDLGDSGQVGPQPVVDHEGPLAPVAWASSLSVSGLSHDHVVRTRDLAMQAAVLGVVHSAQIHYTQGAQRWQGIRLDKRAWKGQYPTEADCSAFFTWCVGWCGLTHYHCHDRMNGEKWGGGYTGTLMTHGQQVHSNFQHGDAVLYGHGFPDEHVAIYVGGGMVISHGSEIGPLKCSMHYRSDLQQVRRFI